MKYIYYILALLLALSAAVGYQLFSPVTPQRKAALIINDKVIAMDDFEQLYRAPSARHESKGEFISNLITKELLIQESQRQGIDREESFRLSIQNFYEQSLIKLLMERQFSTFAITVDEAEVERYRALAGRRFRLTVFRFATTQDAARGPYRSGEEIGACFDDLAKDVREAVAGLTAGQFSQPIRTGGRILVVRLDRTEDAPSCSPAGMDNEQLRRAILEDKKEQLINEWIAHLREKALVKILVDERT